MYFTTSGASAIPGRALWLNADASAVISHAVTIADVAPEYAPRGVSLIAASAVGDAADRPDADLESAAHRGLAGTPPDDCVMSNLAQIKQDLGNIRFY